MNKSDLKTGMVVTLRDGSEYMVIKDFQDRGDALLSNKVNDWNSLQYYQNDFKYNLMFNGDHDWDIVKITSYNHPYCISSFFGVDNVEVDSEVIWTENQDENQQSSASCCQFRIEETETSSSRIQLYNEEDEGDLEELSDILDEMLESKLESLVEKITDKVTERIEHNILKHLLTM